MIRIQIRIFDNPVFPKVCGYSYHLFSVITYCVQWQISGENPQGSMVSALEMLTNKILLEIDADFIISHNGDRSIAISRVVVLKIKANCKPQRFLPVRFS